MTKHWRDILIGITVVVLSLLSVIIVISNAGDEPYVTFRHSDAMIQVGGAFVLLLLWFEFGAWTVAAMFRKKISGLWSPVLIWAVIVCFYVSHCPFGYVEDITKFVVERH